jgi:hypothetical protein
MGGEPTDMLNSAMGMAATGVGLGILGMGAMVPITMTKKMMEEGTGKSGKKMKMPKFNISVDMPKIKPIKKMKLNF